MYRTQEMTGLTHRLSVNLTDSDPYCISPLQHLVIGLTEGSRIRDRGSTLRIALKILPEMCHRSLASPRSVRLVSGLTLGLFLLTHFINLMMGLVSTHEMESARPLLTGLWSTPVGACVLYGALAIHVTLALRALYNRHTLAMSGREAAQLAFGLTFPFLLVAHVVGTAVVPLMSGHRIAFAQEVYALWVASPWTAGRARAPPRPSRVALRWAPSRAPG